MTNKSLNEEFAFRFRRWLMVQHYALSTQDAYCRIVLSLCRYIGNKALQDVTPMVIGDFLTHRLPERWSDDHVAYRLGALRCFFDFLYLGGIVDSVNRQCAGSSAHRSILRDRVSRWRSHEGFVSS